MFPSPDLELPPYPFKLLSWRGELFAGADLRKNLLRGSGGGYPIASRDRLRTAYTDRWDYLILNLAGMALARIIAIVGQTSVAW